MTWQDCAVGGAEKDVFLDLTLMEHSQEKRERDAAQFLHLLRELYLCMHNPNEDHSQVDELIDACREFWI